jgi:hypothetical protein
MPGLSNFQPRENATPFLLQSFGQSDSFMKSAGYPAGSQRDVNCRLQFRRKQSAVRTHAHHGVTCPLLDGLLRKTGTRRSFGRFVRKVRERLRSEGVTFLSLLGKVVGTARKIRGFFASLRMTNKKVTASQNDRVLGCVEENNGRQKATADPLRG